MMMNTLYIILLPLILFAGSIVVILLDAFFVDAPRKTYLLSLIVLIATVLTSLFLWPHQGSAFNGMIVLDSFSLIASFLFCLTGLVTLLLLDESPLSTSQFHALLLLTLIGMILLVSGTNFLILFIGLEILSLSIYVLAAFAKQDPLSAESGMKYFLLGSFASAFFLYGVAFIYGATGSMQLNQVAAAIGASGFASRSFLFLGLIFLLVGYAFKISLAPFHMWTPDVYEGAPTPVTAFMAATVKAAALASLIRVFLVSFSQPSISQFWMPIIWVLAVITMFIGNLTAIWQNNLKRLLAYSSIAHAGYMLLGLLASPVQAQQSILYYFAAYIFMNLGAFAVVAYLERSAGIITVDQYQSLAYTRPVISTCMMLFLLSLGGLPPTAGFFGKFYLFRAVLQEGHVWAVVLAVLNSAISFYYYLRIVIVMFTPEKEAAQIQAGQRIALPLIVTLILTVWGTISLGLFPGFFLELARSVSLFS
jgi:NADH-quinone oxidoreductase subunit N